MHCFPSVRFASLSGRGGYSSLGLLLLSCDRFSSILSRIYCRPFDLSLLCCRGGDLGIPSQPCFCLVPHRMVWLSNSLPSIFHSLIHLRSLESPPLSPALLCCWVQFKQGKSFHIVISQQFFYVVKNTNTGPKSREENKLAVDVTFRDMNCCSGLSSVWSDGCNDIASSLSWFGSNWFPSGDWGLADSPLEKVKGKGIDVVWCISIPKKLGLAWWLTLSLPYVSDRRFEVCVTDQEPFDGGFPTSVNNCAHTHIHRQRQ